MDAMDDVTVLDFSQLIAGPACTQWLASFGAEVIKVEPPEGEGGRRYINGSYLASFNLGGKRSIALDLKADEGAAAAREMARSADVVVENFRPGVLERFDLDYESVSAANPGVVYCSMSGFGQAGPKADHPSLDPLAQAEAGLIDITGYADGPPTRIGTSAVDVTTGMLGAMTVSAALRQRDRTGEGEHVDVSLFDTAISWMAYWISEYASTGDVPVRTGQSLTGDDGAYGLFSTTDEDWEDSDELVYLVATRDEQFASLCRAIDREDLLEADEYESRESRARHAEELREELESAFRAYDRDELVDVLAAEGVVVGAVQNVADLVDDDPQVEALDLLVDTYNYERGTESKTVRPAYRTTDGVPEMGDRPPALGEHSRDVLADYGYEEDEIERLVEEGVVVETEPDLG